MFRAQEQEDSSSKADGGRRRSNGGGENVVSLTLHTEAGDVVMIASDNGVMLVEPSTGKALDRLRNQWHSPEDFVAHMLRARLDVFPGLVSTQGDAGPTPLASSTAVPVETTTGESGDGNSSCPAVMKNLESCRCAPLFVFILLL